jgi:2-polyprenyl-6-methoxyphenol hydroxylase-like FAD-dependent oxidoreductase
MSPTTDACLPVVIVGGSPPGLMAAERLSAAGLPVHLVAAKNSAMNTSWPCGVVAAPVSQHTTRQRATKAASRACDDGVTAGFR